MKDTNVVSSPSVTSTRNAGDWRDTSAFCFVNEDTYSETFGGLPPEGSGRTLIDALEEIEEELDDAREARAALGDPSEYPTVSWRDLRAKKR